MMLECNLNLLGTIISRKKLLIVDITHILYKSHTARIIHRINLSEDVLIRSLE